MKINNYFNFIKIIILQNYFKYNENDTTYEYISFIKCF